ncbi:hypothetical protein BGW80DRAFT_185712 [Lactifluus volemus]|nr:hypothetical protein BGW80DRAFT_185712 [Lactifluus volemus]
MLACPDSFVCPCLHCPAPSRDSHRCSDSDMNQPLERANSYHIQESPLAVVSHIKHRPGGTQTPSRTRNCSDQCSLTELEPHASRSMQDIRHNGCNNSTRSAMMGQGRMANGRKGARIAYAAFQRYQLDCRKRANRIRATRAKQRVDVDQNEKPVIVIHLRILV